MNAPETAREPRTEAGRQLVAQFDVGQFGRVLRLVLAIEAEMRAGSGEARIADLEGALKALYSEINEFFSMHPDMDNPDFVPTGKVRMPGDWLRDIRVALDMEPGAGSGEAAGLREALAEIVAIEDKVDAAWRDISRGLFFEQLQDLDDTRRTAIDRARALLAAPAAPTGAASTGLDVERLAKALELIGDDPYGCKWADEGRGHHGHAFAVALAAEYDRLAAPAPETAAADR